MPEHNNHVGLRAHQFNGRCIKRLEPAVCMAAVEREVFPFDVAEFPQPLVKRLVAASALLKRQKADARDFVGGVCARRERAGQSDGGEEKGVSGLSHRITSSARNSSSGGIVIPSALAVLRLITSSNFVGCSTGILPGLAPLRILST